MTARAEATAETGRRIVDAAIALFVERPFDELTLEETASRAGVTLQTVLRRFGSKAALVGAAAETAIARVSAQRSEAPVGDVAAAVENLFDHYEAWGDLSLRMLAQEDRFERLGQLAREGRALHRAWVERVFAPAWASLRGAARVRRQDQLVVVCDVYVWKLLRRDLGQSRGEAQKTVLGLVEKLHSKGVD